MNLARDPDAKADDLARVVSTDQAIAARVLRISRSTLYLRRQPPRTLPEAIVTVGLSGLRRILIAASARSAYRASDSVAEALWKHALATAIAASELGREQTGKPSGDDFVAGLLHDVGRLVFHLANPDQYVRLGHSDGALEEELFGAPHAAVGACLAEQWGLEEAVVEAIMFHHHPGRPSSLSQRIATADRIAHEIHFGSVAGDLVSPFHQPTSEELRSRVADVFAAEFALFD
jgi:putative nucleotidyltransferase with HDIG domain